MKELQKIEVSQPELRKAEDKIEIDPDLLAVDPSLEVVGEALSYLRLAKKAFNEIRLKYAELVKVANASMNTALDDEDRKTLHKTFQEIRSQYDSEIANREIRGDKLFSGVFEDTPKEFEISEGAKISMRISRLDSEALRLDRLKIDSLVNARKATVELEEAKVELEKQAQYIDTKIENAEFRFKQNKSKAEAKMANAKESSNKIMSKREFVLKDLRRRQEKIAEMTGDDLGNLIETKG